MARYRKIDPRIWNDAKFSNLSDQAKLVFLFLLTHPNLTVLGAMRASLPGLAAELGWDTKGFAKGFDELFRQGMAKLDEKAAFVWIPRFLKYNAPENPNVVKSWAAALDLLPECDLYFQMIQYVKEFTEGLPKPFREALPKGFGNGMPNQEQEQEQKQELFPPTPHVVSLNGPAKVAKHAHPSKIAPEGFVVTDEMQTWAETNHPGVNITYETQKFLDYEFKEAHTDWVKTWRGWIRRAWEHLPPERRTTQPQQHRLVL